MAYQEQPRLLKKLAQRANALSESKNVQTLPVVDGLILYRTAELTGIDALVYEPALCLILQGEKRTQIGGRTFELATGSCIVISHDVPVLAEITQASASEPYLAVVFRLELDELRSLEAQVDNLTFPDEGAHSYENALVDENTLDVIRRIFDLIEKPTESSVLLPLLKRELHYRLLLSDAGGSLRSLLHRDSPASSIALATRQLRDKYRQSLDVTALARLVGMSVSSFHQHFKDITHTTPLQFQKNLRLTEARRQLREGKESVSQISFEVGYESSSQFSREYSRKFGQAPSLDLGS